MANEPTILRSELVRHLAKSISEHAPLPEIEESFTLADAYELQHQVTAVRSPGKTGGIKAGVTAKPIQEFFGIDHALLGSLYHDGRLNSGCELAHLEGRNIECEIAVLVDEKGTPTALAPALEIVYVNFSRPSDMTAPNLVACNLGADLFVVGDFRPWTSVREDMTATLSHNGETVNRADMTDALGGPKEAVPWIWAEAQKRGFQFSGETLLLTGSCGQVVPAGRGDYVADYGELGAVELSIS